MAQQQGCLQPQKKISRKERSERIKQPFGSCHSPQILPATLSSLSHAGQEQSRVQKSPCSSRDALGNGAGIHLVQLSLKSAFLGALQDKTSNSGGHSARSFSPWLPREPLVLSPLGAPWGWGPSAHPLGWPGLLQPSSTKLHLGQAVRSGAARNGAGLSEETAALNVL